MRPVPLGLACLLFGCAGLAAAAAPAEQLVFGSFRNEDNAVRYSAELAREFAHPVVVEAVHRDGVPWFRVRTGWLSADERARLEAAANGASVEFWVVRGTVEWPDTVTAARSLEVGPIRDSRDSREAGEAGEAGEVGEVGEAGDASRRARVPAAAEPRTDAAGRAPASGYTDLDLGLQARTYRNQGFAGQNRFHPSVSARFTWHRDFADGTQSVTVTPFARLDAADDERSHFDLRELYWSLLGADWELHAGFRQVFWGVTEFKHLVDVINQTDLVEDIDGEEKLGQPMVHLSLVRGWGVLDLFALTGFRERTFPGQDGRLRALLPVDTDRADYESGAGAGRIDGAVRWSHDIGPLGVGLYHFSGNSRDPLFTVEAGAGGPRLVPLYPVIDQSGLDAQWLTGDWAFKAEALRRSGFGPTYVAWNLGFERTLVGVLGTRADLGVVVEYLYDQRGAEAFDTLFERDLALGTRWSFNDHADTQALAGVIVDRHTRERVVSLEATRRLGTAWLLSLEGRLFEGADPPGPAEPLESLLVPGRKSAALQRDDYIQLELTRYF